MDRLSNKRKIRPILDGGFYAWDIVQNTFWADSRYATIMNVNLPELDKGLSAESFLETVHPDDRPGVIERMKLTVIDKQPFQIAYRVSRGDDFKLVQDYGQCMRSIDGYATLFTGIVFEAGRSDLNSMASNSNFDHARGIDFK